MIWLTPTTTTINTPTTTTVPQRPNQPNLSFVVVGLLLALLPPPWGLGAVLAWLAVAFVIAPPQYFRPQFWVVGIIGAWIILQCVLPAPHIPLWRSALKIAGIDTGNTIAVQPFLSAALWPAWIAGGLAFIWFMGRTWEENFLKKLLRVMAVILGVLSIVAAGCLSMGVKNPIFPSADIFTYFDNRNQSATLYAISVIIGLGLVLYEKRYRRKVVGLMALFGGLLAVILGPARGGWISVAVGATIMLAANRRHLIWLLGGIVGAAILLLVANPTSLAIHEGTAPEIRLGFYQDTLRLIAQNPWGVGLGNFSAVFPHYQGFSPYEQLVLHPEQDWLWVGAELGIMAILIPLAAFTIPWTTPRRWIIVAGVLGAFLAPSLFDVPAHRLGLALPVMALVASLVKAPSENCKITRGRHRLGLVAAGVALLALGVGIAGNGILGRATVRFNGSLEAKSLEMTRKTYLEVQALTPLDFVPRLSMMRAELRWGGSKATAAKQASEMLALNPALPALPLWISYDWQPVEKATAMRYWREALRRTLPEYQPSILRQLINANGGGDGLGILCGRSVPLWDVLLENEQNIEMLNQAAPQGVDILKLKRAPLIKWASTPATASQALTYLQATPKAPKDLTALAYGTTGQVRKACELLLPTLPAAPLADKHPMFSANELRLQGRIDPEREVDYLTSLAARAQTAGDLVQAGLIIEEIAIKPHAPLNIVRLYAEALIKRDKWQDAWKILSSTIVP